MLWGLASIVFDTDTWEWVAIGVAVVLVPLAWIAARPGSRTGTTAVALALRTLGIGLLLLCLLDPQWTSPRAKPGANFFAVLADNSQSMRITDAGATITRGEQMRNSLTGEGSRWLASLSNEYQLRPYIFDDGLHRVRDFTALDFQGSSTALGGALREVHERFAGQPLAGILLFTDGDATDLTAGLADLHDLPPVYPVVVGKADGLHDISIARADVHQTDFDDAPVSLDVQVAGLGAANRDVSVNVRPLNTPGVKNATPDGLKDAKTVHMPFDNEPAQVTFDWKPLGSSIQFYEVTAAATGSPLFEDATLLNNRRIVMVDRGRPAYRILYVAGRPNWDFKYLNRSLEDDPQMQMVGLIRVAKREPKYSFIGRGSNTSGLFLGFDNPDDTQAYDQPVLTRVNTRDDKELASGFPITTEDLYQYDAIILGDLEAGFFTSEQLALIRRFVAERGGGLLMLGGAESLDQGGYADTVLANALPVYLSKPAPAVPNQSSNPQSQTAQAIQAITNGANMSAAAAGANDYTWNLTREGWLEPWMRVRPLESDERTRLEEMPHFQVSNKLSGIKPGATVLATVTNKQGQVFPALTVQNYGAGRVGTLTIADMYLWGLQSDTNMTDLGHFWRQMARWLVTDAPAQVELHTRQSTKSGGGMELRITARDQNFRPLDLATANITIQRVATGTTEAAPGFEQVTLPTEPVPDAPGQFAATFAPRDPGSYLAQAKVFDPAGQLVGTAQAGWVNDPAIDEFQTLTPNRALMEELARKTGGQVIEWSQLDSLASMLPTKAARITEISSHPIWDESPMFLAVLVCFLAEWAWRRWKGLP